MDSYLQSLKRLAVNGCQASAERIRRFSPPRWRQLVPCIHLDDEVVCLLIDEKDCELWDRRISHARHIYHLKMGNARNTDAWAQRTGWRISSSLSDS